MKANELRIGNWVSTVDEQPDILQIVGIKQYDYDSDDDCVRLDSINDWIPVDDLWEIPITAEWLERFGFENWEHNDNCFIKKYSHQGELIIFNHKTIVAEGAGAKVGEFYYMFHDLIHIIKYVHQLQNLYFALTGEELNYKP